MSEENKALELTWPVFDALPDGQFLHGVASLIEGNMLRVRVQGGREVTTQLGGACPEAMAKQLLREVSWAVGQ